MNEFAATVDFESRSACSLKNAGAWNYSLHPTTEIMCLVYRLPYWPEGQTALWTPPYPKLGIAENFDSETLLELLDWIDQGELLEAHNSFFERAIWTNILTPKHGFPLPAPDTWRCSAAKAAAHALPRALEDANPALRLSILKDEEGSKVMKKLSKPRKPRKKERELWAASNGTAPHPIVYFEDYPLFEKLWSYCRQDVQAEGALSHSLDDLNPQETQNFILDQKMNQRGFRLDLEAVEIALALISGEVSLLNSEMISITGGAVQKATQRDRMKAWLATEGLVLYDTKGATIDDILQEAETGEASSDPFAASIVGSVSPAARRALEILRTLGRSSTAKYETMLDWVCPDGRVRGGLLFHGATTGRWSGKGVQPHNFPKSTIKDFDMEAAWKLIKTGDRDAITAVYPSVMETLACALRGAIVPSKGNQLFVADYAGIEVRVLWWAARDKVGLELLRTGADPYCALATDIYDRPITKHDKDERGLGKVGILGCFAAETLVLTFKGWVPINNITLDDLVWDGIEWVHHDGIVNQGTQETIQWLDINVTPNHQVWTGTKWQTAQFLAADENILCLQSALNSVNLPLLDIDKVSVVELQVSKLDVPALPTDTMSLRVIFEGGYQPDATFVQNAKAQRHENASGGMQISWLTTSIEHGCLTVSVPSLPDVRIQKLLNSPITAGGVSEFVPIGLRDMALDDIEPIPSDDVDSSRISSLYPDGMNHDLNWTGKTIIAAMNREISALLPEPSISETDVKSARCSKKSQSLKIVYDIVNAGPRHRFTILTNQGPLIVSNCGYGMGATKFIATCASWGITIDDEMSQKVVDTYRSKFHRVKSFWYETEDAAIAAVAVPGRAVKNGYCSWQRVVDKARKTDFLFCTLPNGRRLAYPFPELRERQTPWGAVKMALTFMGMDSYSKKWKRQHSYGGSLVENVVQAISRDILAEGLHRIEASGTYIPVLSIHDEAVAEAKIGHGSVAEFENLLTQVPKWAPGCPISAEGWSGLRYRK